MGDYSSGIGTGNAFNFREGGYPVRSDGFQLFRPKKIETRIAGFSSAISISHHVLGA